MNCKATHLLFDCQITKQKCLDEWSKVKDVMPNAMSQDVSNMSNQEKMLFIANGMNSEMTVEWSPLYHQMTVFVKNVWKEIDRMLLTNE